MQQRHSGTTIPQPQRQHKSRILNVQFTHGYHVFTEREATPPYPHIYSSQKNGFGPWHAPFAFQLLSIPAHRRCRDNPRRCIIAAFNSRVCMYIHSLLLFLLTSTCLFLFLSTSLLPTAHLFTIFSSHQLFKSVEVSMSFGGSLSSFPSHVFRSLLSHFLYRARTSNSPVYRSWTSSANGLLHKYFDRMFFE